MQTSERVYHRVRWDPRFDPTRFVIGVDVHGERPKRVALVDFVPGGDIPWHRVLFFEADGEIVWDRRTGVDRLGGTAAGAATRVALLRAPAFEPRTVRAPVEEVSPRGGPLRVLTWNTLFDRFDQDRIHTARRRPLLVDAIARVDADVVALQEVQRPLVDLLLAHPFARRSWVVSHDDVDHHGLFLLSRRPLVEAGFVAHGRHKGALAAVLDGEGRPVVVLTTHLLSDHARDGARRRAEQLGALGALVAELDAEVVVSGDFNDDGDAPQRVLGARDAWIEAGRVPEPTFDPVENPLAAVSSLSGRPVRIDRVLLRGDLRAAGVARVGTEPVDGLHPSDHYGVLAELAEATDAAGPGASVPRRATPRSALCWILPEEHAADVQAVRREHDPAFDRWPPHVNVRFGFVPEHVLDQVLPALGEGLRAVAPFVTTLRELSVFHHRDGGTVWLEPSEQDAWRGLHRACAEAVPLVDERAWTPHLTVGRSDRPEAAAARWRDRLPPVTARVDALAVVTRRADEPMRVRATIELGTGRVTAVRPAPLVGLLGPPRSAEEVVERLRRALPEADLRVVGSRALGCALADADLDLVGTGEPRQAAARLRGVDGVADLRVLDASRALGVQLTVDGLGVDLALVDGSEEQRVAAARAVDDASAWLAAVGDRADEARELLRTVKAWARAQGLDSAPFGGLPGVGWAVLAARSVLESPPGSAGLAAFFERWAGHPEGLPVALGEVEGLEPGVWPIACPGAPVRSCSDALLGSGLRTLREAMLAAWVACDGEDPLGELLRPPELHREHARWLLVELAAAPDELGTAVGRVRGRFRQLLGALDRGDGSPRAWPWPVARSPSGRTWAVALGGGGEGAAAVAKDWARGSPGTTVTVVDADRVPTLSVGR